MLPQSHVAYTVAATNLLARRIPALRAVDLRWVAIAAMGPDLIDKPLAAIYFYRKYRSAVLFAHTLLAHVAIIVAALRGDRRWLPYALAFNGHALLDRLWFYPDTLLWPFRGWRFHVWRKRGSEQANMRMAYWHAFTRRPELWGWEAGGLLAALWFIWSNRLWERERFVRLLRTGRV